MNPEDIAHRFAFHSAAGDVAKQEAHTNVREACANLAHYLSALVPAGREKALVVTKLEEVMFWANAAIAREVRS